MIQPIPLNIKRVSIVVKHLIKILDKMHFSWQIEFLVELPIHLI